MRHENTGMVFYAVQKRSEPNRFLPGGDKGRGFSHDVPTAWWACPPRLFRTRKSASQALRLWLKGRHIKKWKGRGTPDEYTYVKVEPVMDRLPEDYEVVEIRMEVVR